MVREHATAEDDLLEAIREDELTSAIGEFRARQQVDDAEDWSALPQTEPGFHSSKEL